MWICVVQIFWAIPSVIGASLALFDFIYAAKAACPGSLLMRVQHFLFVRSVCCMNALKKFKLFATFVVTVAWENGFLMFIYARYRNIISFLCVTPSLLLPRHFLSFSRYLRIVCTMFLLGEFQFRKCLVYVPYSHDTRKCVRPVQSQIECCMWGWLCCLPPHRDLAHLISLELVLQIKFQNEITIFISCRCCRFFFQTEIEFAVFNLSKHAIFNTELYPNRKQKKQNKTRYTKSHKHVIIFSLFAVLFSGT